MEMSPSVAWKVALAIVLGAGILASAYAKAPRHAASGTRLARLVACALALYGTGAIASITHHPLLAGLMYGSGIAICAIAIWLSRGNDSDPGWGDQPADEQPPPDPDGVPPMDWGEFERAFRAYAARDRDRDPAGRP
jgi:hypothetical protein